MLGRGNVLIAQGTHGRIYKISNSQVAKVFENRVFNKECICSRIRTSCKTTCDHIHHEYLVQKLLYDELMGKTQIKIKIPQPLEYHMDARKHECQIKMEYIHPSSNTNRPNLIGNNNQLIQINMGEPHMDDIMPGVGRFLGINRLDLSNCDISRPDELAFELGRLFSYLHYVLRLDGFDCELVLGRGGDNKYTNKDNIFFIDFDKVACFEFILGYVVNRKIDENLIEPKTLDSVLKFAWFLLGGITGMSLLPSNSELKDRFQEGYSSYAPDDDNGIAWQVYKKVQELINEKNNF